MTQTNLFPIKTKKNREVQLCLFEQPVNNYNTAKIYSDFADSVERDLTALIIDNRHNEELRDFLLIEKVKMTTFFQKSLKELKSNKTTNIKYSSISTAIKKFFKLK